MELCIIPTLDDQRLMTLPVPYAFSQKMLHAYKGKSF